MSDIKIKDLLRLFPQVICGVENLNVISNGRVDLSELAVESGMTEIVENNSQVYRDFIKKNEKYIDMNKYLTYQLACYKDMPLEEQELQKYISIIKELLKDRPNTTIYMLAQENGVSKVVEYSSSKGLIPEKKEVKLGTPKYDKIFDDENLFMNLVGILMTSDLRKILPNRLVEIVEYKALTNAIRNTPDVDLDNNPDNNIEFRMSSVSELMEDISRFKDKLNIDNLLLIAGYRLKHYIQENLTNGEVSETELQSIEVVFNHLSEVSDLLGDSRKIKFKGKLETKEDGKYKYVSYSAKELSSDVARLRKLVLPNNFKVKDDVLEDLKEGDLTVKKLFEKVRKPDELIDQEDTPQIDKLAKYKINFVSPEEKKAIFYSYNEQPIAYRGTKGKAYEGHAIFIYPRKAFAILECFYNKDKDGVKRYSYGNATVIVPIEQLEEFLKSKEKLENIPLARELKAPSGEKARPVKYVEIGKTTKKQLVKRTEQRRPVRIYHTKNWKQKISDILSGKLNPFLITIVSSQRKKVESTETKERSSTEVESQQLV